MSTARSREMKRNSNESENRDALAPLDDVVSWLRTYVRQEPEVSACVCLGIGFILGWKLKPW